jgi:hypothetical protein
MSSKEKKSNNRNEVTVEINLKDNFTPKVKKLTTKLNRLVEHFESIGIKLDFSCSYDVEKIKEHIEIKQT